MNHIYDGRHFRWKSTFILQRPAFDVRRIGMRMIDDTHLSGESSAVLDRSRLPRSALARSLPSFAN